MANTRETEFKLNESRRENRELKKHVQALTECLEYYIGPIEVEVDTESDGPYSHPRQVYRVRTTVDHKTAEAFAALGVLRKMIGTERGQELVEECKRFDVGVDVLRVAAASFGERLRNGTERLTTGPHRLCVQCKLPLVGLRRDARFCSDRCRMLSRNRKKEGQRLVRVRKEGGTS